MKTLVVVLFVSVLFPALASANVGAAVNMKTGRISYFSGTISVKALRSVALKECRKEALAEAPKGEKPARCMAVENKIGECSDPKGTGRAYGAFAGHFYEEGWFMKMACAPSFDAARDILSKICSPCAMGETFFDDSVQK
jgi:hypothetical protein